MRYHRTTAVIDRAFVATRAQVARERPPQLPDFEEEESTRPISFSPVPFSTLERLCTGGQS